MKFIREVPSLAPSLLLNSLLIIPQEFLKIKLEEFNLIMILVLLVGVKKMELNIGSSETLGDHTGDKTEPSDSSEEQIISTFKVLALGQFQKTHGPMIQEMRLSYLLKKKCLRQISRAKDPLAEENHPNSCQKM